MDVIQAYAEARASVDQLLDEYGVPSNDNKVGRIGEYFAFKYLANMYQDNKISFVKGRITPYDIIVDDQRYSVKAISPENSKLTTEVKMNGEWDFLLVCLLDSKLSLDNVSIISYEDLCAYSISKIADLYKDPDTNVISKKGKSERYKLRLYWSNDIIQSNIIEAFK